MSLCDSSRIMSGDQELFELAICSRRFELATSLLLHLQLSLCDSSWSRRSAVLVHIKRENGDYPPRCQSRDDILWPSAPGAARISFCSSKNLQIQKLLRAHFCCPVDPTSFRQPLSPPLFDRHYSSGHQLLPSACLRTTE